MIVNTQSDRAVGSSAGNAQKRQLCSRLTLEMAQQGRIWIYTFARKMREDHTSSRLAIDAWAASILAEFRSLPGGTSWYHLNDFSQTDMHPSPYFVSRVREITRTRADLKGHSAIVIPKNLFTQMMLNLAQQVRTRHISVKLYFKRADALQWLAAQLDGASSGVSERRLNLMAVLGWLTRVEPELTRPLVIFPGFYTVEIAAGCQKISGKINLSANTRRRTIVRRTL
jgi:hypothetical protein